MMLRIKYYTLTLFLLLPIFLSAAPSSIENCRYVNTKEALSVVLDKISSHYLVNLVFDDQHVRNIDIQNFTFGESLEADLNEVLSDTDLKFKKLNSSTYVIKPAENQKTFAQAKIKEKVSILKITGVIKDAETQETLIGASIKDLSTGLGTISDIDGKFELEVEPSATIQVAYVGYQTQEVIISSGTTIEIQMQKDAQIIEEIVVVGYGSQRKSDLTGAVSRIGAKELKQLPSTGIEQAIQGRTSGVYITQNSGSPGGAMSVRIRGTGSTLSAEPLYVVDGIPIVNDNAGSSATFESDGGGQYSNALTTINPNDIESVEILKDASATAIYGARAANGVVLITTKKGKSGESSISFENYMGIQQLYKKIDVMNLREYAEYITEVSLGDIEEFENLELLGDGTDWQDVIFRDALMNNHQINVSGGDEKTRFSITGGMHNKDGIVEGSNFQRYSAKLNVDHNVNSRFRMGVNMMASRTRENIVFNDNSNGVIYTALLTPPMVPARTLDGTFGEPPTGENVVLTFDNPLANALEVEDLNRKSRLLGSMWAEYNLTPSLKYKIEVATDVLYANHNTFWPSFQRGTQSRKSRVRRNTNNSLYWINKHLLSFNKTFTERHRLNMLAGFEAQSGSYEWLSASRDNLPTNELAQLNLGDAGTQLVQGGAGHWALLSYFGRMNYGFDERYLLTATLRSDGSSRFGENNRYGLFPSLAFAWRISNEKWMKQFDNLYNAKLRLGYGAVGNQEIGLYSFASNLRSISVVVGDQLITGFGPDNISNPNVKWESSVQFNLGLDIGFYNNRIELTADIYNKTSRDMLLPAILPATAGGLNPPFINIGEMRNTGIELGLVTQNYTGKFDWKTTANISFNQNEVVDLGSTGALTGLMQRVPITRTEEGLPIGQYFGHQVEGIFNDLEEVESSPFQEVGTRPGDIKFKDLNGDDVINELDKTFIGSPHPDFTVNLINDFSYKSFDFTFFLRGVYGNEVYNLLKRDLAGTGAWHNQSIEVQDRWTLDNLDGSEPRANGNDPNANRRVSDRFVEDGSFVRLQNVSVGYNVPVAKTKGIGISNARFYLSGQNIFTVTNYTGYDPEIGSFNQNPLINGVDNGRFPVARSFTFGINLNF